MIPARRSASILICLRHTVKRKAGSNFSHTFRTFSNHDKLNNSHNGENNKLTTVLSPITNSPKLVIISPASASRSISRLVLIASAKRNNVVMRRIDGNEENLRSYQHRMILKIQVLPMLSSAQSKNRLSRWAMEL